MRKLSRKQLAVVYILVAIICICFVGIFLVLRNNSSKTKEVSETVNATTQALADAEKENQTTTAADMVTVLTPLLGLETTSELDADKIAYYYEVEAADMEECAGVIADVALADELVIMKAKDETALEKLKTGAKNRLESQKTSFQDYIPKQAKRLEDAQVVTEGNYVMFICCEDVDTVVSKFRAMAGK